MATNKTTKAFTKRLKITRTGKVKSRRPGKNHYNAKKSGESKLSKKREKDVDIKQKTMDEFLPHQ